MGRRSIASVVRDVVMTKPCVMECLVRGLINYSALARYVLPEIKSSLGLSTINVGTIKVSLVRLRDRLSKELRIIEDKVLSILARSALRLEMDLIVITVSREYIQQKLSSLIHELRNARFLQITQGINTYTIVIAKEDLNKLTSLLGRNIPIDIIDDQAAIILISPKEILTTPGFVSYVTGILAWNGINITQIISCYLDTILIINSNDALKAYSLLHSLIMASRKRLR